MIRDREDTDITKIDWSNENTNVNAEQVSEFVRTDFPHQPPENDTPKITAECDVISDGVYDISNHTYHSHPAISRSALMRFKRSPYHYQQDYLTDYKDTGQPTPSMIVGELVHTLVLEPEKFHERYFVDFKVDRRTREGKLSYANMEMQARGKTRISEQTELTARNIALGVQKNEIARNLFSSGEIEQSIFFTHKQTGLQVKSRPDLWKDNVVIDLKTTVDASFRAFQSSASSYGYFLQAGMIHEALASIDIKMESFIFIAVEKKYPFAVGIYTLDHDALDWGINHFNELMGQFAKCKSLNEWPGFPILSLTLPAYANYDTQYHQFDEEEE